MSEVRWQRRSGSLLVALGIAMAASAAPAMVGAQSPPTEGRGPCGTPRGPALGSWYRRTAQIDERGWLRGYRLDAGRPDGSRTVRVQQSPESFASTPVAGTLLHGSDDGARSVVRTTRLAGGCDRVLFSTRHVVRRGTLAPSGDAAYLHLVDRRTRADLGIWRYRLSRTEKLVRVMPGLADPSDGPFGRTWATRLTWSASGRTLAVQSCGQEGCRTRLLTVSTGRWVLDDRPGQGGLIGLDESTRYGYAACHGLPCPIVAIGVDGRQRQLTPPAGTAAFLGHEIWYEAPTRAGAVELRVADTSGRHDHAVTHGRGRLAWPAASGDAGVELPPGTLAFTNDGTWTDLKDVRLRRVTTPQQGVRAEAEETR